MKVREVRCGPLFAHDFQRLSRRLCSPMNECPNRQTCSVGCPSVKQEKPPPLLVDVVSFEYLECDEVWVGQGCNTRGEGKGAFVWKKRGSAGLLQKHTSKPVNTAI